MVCAVHYCCSRIDLNALLQEQEYLNGNGGNKILVTIGEVDTSTIWMLCDTIEVCADDVIFK